MHIEIVGSPGMRRLADDVSRLLGGQFVGLYLEGSFVWGAELPTSDIDLRVVADGPLDATARGALATIANRAAVEIGRSVDLQIDVLADLLRIGAVRFHHAIPVSGRDVRSLVPSKPLEAFASDSTASARRLATSLRTLHGTAADFPLCVPNLELEFRGYEVQQVRVGDDALPSTKRLVSNVLAVATALIATRGYYVLSKHQVAPLYRDIVSDGWSAFVSEIYFHYRVDLGYQLPAGLADRKQLTHLCEQATDFENQLILLR